MTARRKTKSMAGVNPAVNFVLLDIAGVQISLSVSSPPKNASCEAA